jgi:hypothetical protein
MNTGNDSDVEGILANPFYAVIFASHLFKKRPETAKEDWILLNTQLIEEIGSSTWLEEFLDVISLPDKKYDGHDIINPSLAVKISIRLQGDHPPLVKREQWIQANVKLMDELGFAKWLDRLLDVLETGGPEAA